MDARDLALLVSRVGMDEPFGERIKGDTEHGVLEKVWASFQSRHVENARGDSLGYYRGVLDPAQLSTTTRGLVWTTNGQCGAWVRLLRDVLRMQGLDRSLEEIDRGTIYRITPQRNGNPPQACADAPNDLFPFILIRKYMTGDLPSNPPCPAFPHRINHPGHPEHDWPPSQPVTVTDQEGVPDQDSINPASVFGRHFVLRFKGKYYDPSYGAGPYPADETGQLQWENASLYGFAGRVTANPTRFGARVQQALVKELRFDFFDDP